MDPKPQIRVADSVIVVNPFFPVPDGNSVINLGELAKPADTLIHKISDAIGGICAPYQIKRVAKAKAEAGIIKAQGAIAVGDLQRRAIARFVAEEGKKQANIENITAAAIPLLKPGATPENMESDWITNFFDKCRLISDAEMQSLWAKVLAGEANAPGTYSKRTVDFIETLERSDAEAFSQVVGCAWDFGEPQPLIYDFHAGIYETAGLTFPLLSHLDDIGLIRLESLTSFRRTGLSGERVFSYFDKKLAVLFPEQLDLEVGKVLLTRTGLQLAAICAAKPIEGLFDYVIKNWSDRGLPVYSLTGF